MKKINPTVKKETAFIALVTVILSAVLQAIFLVIGKWDITVLFGNILSGFTAVLNFFLMGLTVQKSVEKDEKQAKQTMRLSLTLRNAMILIVAVIGVSVPSAFNVFTVFIPLFFPRIAVFIRGLLLKKEDDKNAK